MKTDLILEFNTDTKTLSIFSMHDPDNPNKVSQKEIELSGAKRQIKLLGEKTELMGSFGGKYTFKIRQEVIRALIGEPENG